MPSQYSPLVWRFHFFFLFDHADLDRNRLDKTYHNAHYLQLKSFLLIWLSKLSLNPFICYISVIYIWVTKNIIKKTIGDSKKFRMDYFFIEDVGISNLFIFSFFACFGSCSSIFFNAWSFNVSSFSCWSILSVIGIPSILFPLFILFRNKI